ncbi:MAG: hypothetical protein SNJ73_08955, partial [Acetobacteraceae bacterium]
GYSDVQIFSASADKGDTLDSVADSIAAAGILAEEARIYAERVLQGNSLVIVRALFGGAVRARQILAQHGPVDSGVAEPSQRLMTSVGDGTASGGGNWLHTLGTAPHPMEALTGWPSLTKEGWMFSDRFGWRYLLDDPTPLSSKFGWKLLSDTPYPLSSKFGWKLLSDTPHPLSSKFGWKLLTGDQEPPKAAAAPAETPAIAAPEAKPETRAKADPPPASPST